MGVCAQDEAERREVLQVRGQVEVFGAGAFAGVTLTDAVMTSV